MLNHPSSPIDFVSATTLFVQELSARNVSPHTLTAYRTDLQQFVTYLQETSVTVATPAQVTRADINEYLSHLGLQGRSGVTRGRKLAVLREFFACLVRHEQLQHAPTDGIRTPKKEQRTRSFLRVDEYTRILSAAGGNPRDYAILQLFLQTGIRVSELVTLQVDDIDLTAKVLRIRSGKGMKARAVPLEKKAVAALKQYFKVRPPSLFQEVFLSYQGRGISDRGVKKLVSKYCEQAGITKQVSCHSLRHTFGTYKAELGVTPFQLQQWLGHENLATTQRYVHAAHINGQRVMEATSL